MGPLCTASALAVVLLGCADPRVMNERIAVASKLHRSHPEAALWVTGTPREVAAARHAFAPGLLCEETQSTNTAENALYMRNLLPPTTREVWVVTSDFHMPRAQAIFDALWRDMRWNLFYVTAEHRAPTAVHYSSMEKVHTQNWRADVRRAVALD